VYDLGYKVHVAGDVESDIPSASVVASANENEKKHVPMRLGKVDYVFDGFKAVVVDSKYSSINVRDCGAEPVMLYFSNKARGKRVLRIDRYFRTSGPAEERKLHARIYFSVFVFASMYLPLIQVHTRNYSLYLSQLFYEAAPDILLPIYDSRMDLTKPE
jgi:hypothetical protein